MPKILLRELKAAAIVRSIGDAAERWSDADFPPRVRTTHAIAARLGYSEPVVEYALDRLFFELRAKPLAGAIESELGSLAALDGFVESSAGGAAFARGVERVVVVSSDTTIGVALLPAVFALCAKCNVVVKDRSDALIAAFFDSLVDERPHFRSAAIAREWTGATGADEAALLASADVVVAFGRDRALREIRAGLRADARFVAFGHRASVGYLDAAALERADRTQLADAIATDALLYDGDGCMSLHALFIAADAAATQRFLAELAAAFERVSIEFPAGNSDPQRAASAAAYRNLSVFRAAAGRGTVFAPAARSATIAFDPPRDRPLPFLPRVLPVFPVHDVAGAGAYIRAHELPIEAVAGADPLAPALAEFALNVGATRISAFGCMQAPPVDRHHGGASRIADFVRWIDRR